MFMRTAFKCYDFFPVFMTVTRREVQLSGFCFSYFENILHKNDITISNRFSTHFRDEKFRVALGVAYVQYIRTYFRKYFGNTLILKTA